jgi:dTDP-4-dehydrorhamnose reductase
VDEIASPTWTADLAGGIAALIADASWGTYHLTNSGYCSRLEWIEEVLRIRGLTGVGVERATQEEFGASYRKPVFSALSLEKARRLGIEMPPWRDALERYLRGGA